MFDLDYLIRRLGVWFLVFLRCLVVGAAEAGGRGRGVGGLKRAGVSGGVEGPRPVEGHGPGEASPRQILHPLSALEVSRAQFTSFMYYNMYYNMQLYVLQYAILCITICSCIYYNMQLYVLQYAVVYYSGKCIGHSCLSALQAGAVATISTHNKACGPEASKVIIPECSISFIGWLCSLDPLPWPPSSPRPFTSPPHPAYPPPIRPPLPGPFAH